MDEVRVCLCVPSPNIVSLRFCDWNSHSARVDSMPPRWSSNGMRSPKRSGSPYPPVQNALRDMGVPRGRV
eukprot:scaffold114019_cov31-Tisochrysis_lutea.AAC.4